MSTIYDPKATEAKWQKKWEEAKAYTIDLNAAKNPYYSMVMFPYPSGDKLHIGHWYNFAPADSLARFMRMQGKDVFAPMGFDAFGLPAENYAIKTGVHPNQSIKANVQTMITQLKRIGTMYDWDKMVNTSQPEYYRWTQWLFLQMHKNKLAYQKEGNVNYCSSCQTVLANEQVVEGKCERCGTEVEQKALKQWFWQITKYAQKMLDGLDSLNWPEKTKLMQKNWIGRSEGSEINFTVADMQVAGGLNRRLPDVAENQRTVHLTFSPYKRSSSFEEEKNASKILRIIYDVAQRHKIIIHEAAAMPEHIHLLVSFDRNRDLAADVVKKLKGASAHEYLKDFEDDIHLWGEGCHHENIDSVEQFQNTLQYIQNNPSEAGLDSADRILSKLPLSITVFTTRIDTLFSAAFLVLAPEHPLVDALTTKGQTKAIDEYKKLTAKKTMMQRTDLEKDKTGVFTGSYAINPVNNEKIPVWIADFVIATYGHGAVFGDAHDERDFVFAKKYAIPLKTTIRPVDGDEKKVKNLEECFSDDGILFDSGTYSGQTSQEARKNITDDLAKSMQAKSIINYRLRDWLVSRQRYWGAPIPIVYDPEGNAHPIPEKHLPWLLPTDVEFKPTGKSPLTYSKEFIERTENIFGKGWRPEFDTMDTFVCSSFYYLRYLMEGHATEFVDKQLEEKWMPVDMYIGGPEHATMHLIYARFVMMALKDFGFVSHDEPFQRLVHQGLITNKGAKMSKSKGNVVSPDAFVDEYGSDVFRMFLMFMGPFTQGGDWNDLGIKGIDRFVTRMYRLFAEKMDAKAIDDKAVMAKLHETIKKVTEHIGNLQFNTAISSMMELLNLIEKQPSLSVESAKTIALLLGPLAPHLAEELWSLTKSTGFVIDQKWPSYDPAILVTDTITVVVQINGKVRASLSVAPDISQEEVLALAKAQENVQKYLEGKPLKKEIYVKGKLVSLVVSSF